MNIVGQPLVSVALCTYNGEKFLQKQLDSLLGQTYANIEIIAVDDASTDNTWRILMDNAKRNRKLKLYKNEKNLGYARNFERAIKLCMGDFIALSDQDDIWEKDKISILTESIADNTMVYHDSDYIDEFDKRIGVTTTASRGRTYEGNSCLPFVLSNWISGHATMFKRELINFAFPFDSENYHDWWISYVAFNVGRVKFIDKVLVHYRQHKGSVTDSLGLRKNILATPEPIKKERLSVDISWVKYCSTFKYNKDSGLINEAYTIFSNLKEGKEKLRSLIFMVKYYDLLFYTVGEKPRGFLSKVNFARKLCYN